jgi:hypothetical protein
MRFLVDEKRRVVFGWSAKCGCTFVKRYFFYLTQGIVKSQAIVHNHSSHQFLDKHKKYTKILFIRNPYKRLVSGFLEKYAKRQITLPIKDLTFRKFVDELDQNKLKNIERHHFTPQFSEGFKEDIKFDKVYDIENIDYDYINKIYGKEVNNIETMSHITHSTNYNYDAKEKAYDMTLDELEKLDKKPNYLCFFDNDIERKMHKFYNTDFIHFRQYGFNFTL